MQFLTKKMFKEVFKQFKSKTNPPNMSVAYNFNSKTSISDKVKPYVTKSNLLNNKSTKLSYYGLKPVETWNVYEITEKPGLIFIKNPFTNLGQRYWICRCLRDYTKKPQKSNLDSMVVSDHPHINEIHYNFWEYCNHSDDTLLQKLRWVTLGYHHNWDTKVYDDQSKDTFPSDLSEMCEFIASVLNFNEFKSEAAIINYYHMDSTLSGHTDHSEHNLNAPLFSFSFGQTAVFLVGGLTKDEKPLALFLNSGDIVIMSNETRQCYHAVPIILKTTIEQWNIFNGDDDDDLIMNDKDDVVNQCKDCTYWTPFNKYLQTSRININIRQVF